jgi:hypothetical protein
MANPPLLRLRRSGGEAKVMKPYLEREEFFFFFFGKTTHTIKGHFLGKTKGNVQRSMDSFFFFTCLHKGKDG